MRNIKTTLFGLVSGLAILLNQAVLALDSDPTTQVSFAQIVAAMGLMGIGWKAADTSDNTTGS